MKILIDMNLSPDWVEVFTKANIESTHWSSIGESIKTELSQYQDLP